MVRPFGIVSLFAFVLAGTLQLPLNADDSLFDQQIAPLLARTCLECHSGIDPKGKLDLAHRQTAFTGGESGPSIVPGRPDDSYLMQRIEADEMPPEQHLADAEKQLLRKWIAAGATWGIDPIDPFRITTDRRAGYDWWALQPVIAPELPPVEEPLHANGPIDRFILHRLTAAGLALAPRASRRILIRRLSFDLLGLPPLPTDIDDFAHDDRPDAFERLVDRTLASPHYGIHWTRHWLDVARFGESQGFERDKLRENSWHYRDWVVDAFNSDLPYDAFVRRQIAGDALAPNDPASVIATGFLVAGPYDEVGQNQQSAAMRAVVRQDELEDVVGLVGQTFLGLTVNCARCHDHKFDPVQQREYYQLTAAFAGVKPGERQTISVEDQKRTAQLQRQIDDARRQLAELYQIARARFGESEAFRPDGPGTNAEKAGGDKSLAGVESPNRAAFGDMEPEPIAQWSFEEGLRDEIGGLHGTAHGTARVVDGALILDGQDAYVTTKPIAESLTEKTLAAWVRIVNRDQRGGGVISLQTLDGGQFDAIVFGERDPRRWMAGSNGFVRYQSFQGIEEPATNEELTHIAIVYAADGTITGYRNGLPYGKSYMSAGIATFAAGKSQILFGLRHSPPGGNRLFSGSIAAARLYDRALSAAEVLAAANSSVDGISTARLVAGMPPEQQRLHASLLQQIDDLTALRQQLVPKTVYAVTPLKPAATHVLLRGNPATPGDVVATAGIEAIRGPAPDFGLSPDAPETARRIRLADWITHPDNPLFTRVAANRVWQYHFGVGLVDTPNDFGFNGGRPTHPELIDHLAHELRRSGYGIKHLHRSILTSAVWTQSGANDATARTMDADNRLLWHRPPRRIEAESMRDAILLVTDRLNTEMTGPGYRDFDTFNFNSQFYVMQDHDGAAWHRRSLYRTWVRSARSSLLDVFDCPDPSTKTPKRAVTVTPLQALAMMNNSFVLRMSDNFAKRLREQFPDSGSDRIDRAITLAWGRRSTMAEHEQAIQFEQQYGLAALCRVLFNSSEFLYVD